MLEMELSVAANWPESLTQRLELDEGRRRSGAASPHPTRSHHDRVTASQRVGSECVVSEMAAQ